MLDGRSVDIVVPVFNNRSTLVDLTDRCQSAVKAVGGNARMVFVNDASPDDSAAVLQSIQSQRPETLVLNLPVNGGQQRAIKQGLAHVRDLGVVMDADLQDPPEAIAPMLGCLVKEKHDVVFGTKKGNYQPRLRMLTSKLYRRALRVLVDVPKGAGGFVAVTSSVSRTLSGNEGTHFYLVGLIGCGRYSTGVVAVDRLFRVDGIGSGYNFSSRLKLAILNFNAILKERARASNN